MSMHINKALACDFYAAFNANETDAFDHVLAPDWINHPADPGQPNTPAGFQQAATQTHAAFAGFQITVQAMLAENDLVVCRIEMSGRHIGDFNQWPASGRQVSFTGMDMHRIEGDRIRETWHFENYDGLKAETA